MENNFLSNRKAWAKFGKWSLTVLSLFLLGFFVFQYVIPALAALGAPALVSDINVTIITPSNNSYTSLSNVNFTFNATWNLVPFVDVKNCTLWGNFTGSFAPNVTNSTIFSPIEKKIVNDTTNGLNTSVVDGMYTWNVYCYNTTSHGNYSGSNFTITVDLTPPVIKYVYPAHNGYFNSTNLNFNVTLTEQNKNNTINVTLYYRRQVTGNYQSNTTVCSGTAPNYACNITITDIQTRLGLSEGGLIEFFYNTTDSALITAANGTQDSPWTATLDTTVPPSVTGLNATGNSTPVYYNTTTLMFNWTAPTGDTSGIQYYKIYVNDNLGGYVYNGTNTSKTGYNFTGADTRNYSVNVTAVDNAFNENLTGTVSATMIVDTADPTSVTGLIATGNYTTLYYNTTNITFVWTAATDATSGVQYYKIYVSENASSYVYNGTNTSKTGYNFTGSNGYNYSVNVMTVDIAYRENTTGTVSSVMTVDTTAPGLVTGLTATGNSTSVYFNTTTLMFNWTAATDATSGVQYYKIYVNDSLAGYVYNGTNTSKTGYNFTGADTRNYSVNVTAVDNATNENAGTTSVIMIVDATDPTSVTNLNATGNYTTLYYNTTTLMFNWTAASDTLSGVQYYKIYVKDNLGGYVYNGTNTSKTGYNFTGADTHNYSVNVTTVDIAYRENTTGTVSTTMTVDNAVPNSSIDVLFAANPKRSYSNSTTLVVNWTVATDATSGIQYYKIYVNDNGTGYVYNGTNNSATGYNFTGAGGRNYIVNVTSVDNANNENTTGNTSSTTIIVDTTNPIINNVVPVSGGYFKSPSAVLFQVSLTEQNKNNTNNVTVYYRRQNIGSYQSDTLMCYGSAPDYVCNKTKDISAIIGNNEILQYIFNATDEADRNATNGTQTIPLTATADTAAPNYTSSGDNATTIKIGDPVLIYAYWIDNQYLSHGWLWTNETGAAGTNWTIYNSPHTLTGHTTSWTNFTWQNSTITAGTIVGWRIYANDSAGNENVTTEGSFSIDSTKPQFYSNGTNVTLLATIAKNTPIYIYYNWTDDVGLGYAFLSTNETGAWANYSSSGRILDINLTGTQTWSNFTWQNTSVSPGAVIGIKVFANDTSGNQNVTDEMIWIIDSAKPLYGNNGTNITSGETIVNGTSIFIYTNWTDNIQLHGWWVEHNFTGSPQNTTFNTTFDTGNWTNYTITATATIGKIVVARIFANDTSGNLNYTIPTWNWTIDGTAPTYWNHSNSVSGEATYLPNRSYTFNISWTDNLGVGNVSVVLLNFSANSSNMTTTSLGNSNYSVTLTDLAFGNYTYKWFANDSSNNWNSTIVYTLNVTQNTTNPITVYMVNSTSTITNGNISISAGNIVNVNGTFGYANSGIMDLYSNVTSGTWTNVSSPYITLASLAAGVYAFIANTTGNVNYTANATGPGTFYLTVTADVTAPTVLLYDYTNGTIRKSGASLTLNISVYDATGVAVSDTCNVTIGGTVNRSITYTDANGGWCNGTITVPSTISSDGNYTINITVKDNSTSKNVGFNDSYVLTIDNTTPVVTVSFPTNGTYNKSGSGGYIWINGTVYDKIKMGSGNVTINSSYFNNSVAYDPYSFNGTNNTAFAFRNTSVIPDNYYAIRINYTDSATNTGEVVIYFYVDNTPPLTVIALKNSTAGTYQSSSAQVIEVLVVDNLKANDTITLNYTNYATGSPVWTTVTLTGTPATSTVFSGTIDTKHLSSETSYAIQYYITGTDNATNSIAASVGGSSTLGSTLANITVDKWCGYNGTWLSYCSYSEGWQALSTGATNRYHEAHWSSYQLNTNSLSSNYNISNVLSSISGSYSFVYYRNYSSTTTPWLSYDPNIAWNLNNLRFGNNTDVVYYINMTASSAVIRIV